MATIQLDAGKGQPRVPDGTRVYAIGDIHGRADLLVRLYREIAEDAETGAPKRKVIVHLGDYVDRGPDSAGVIDLALGGGPEGFEPVFLMGNHEHLLLNFLDIGGAGGDVWLVNGGRQTLHSYDVDVASLILGRITFSGTAEEFRANLPLAHLDFYRSLSLYHVEGDYLFVHAGIRPGVALEEQTEQDLLWIRSRFLLDSRDHGHVVVHGHTVDLYPTVRANRIGIDTGAYVTGRLTCLVLEGGEQRFLYA